MGWLLSCCGSLVAGAVLSSIFFLLLLLFFTYARVATAQVRMSATSNDVQVVMTVTDFNLNGKTDQYYQLNRETGRERSCDGT